MNKYAIIIILCAYLDVVCKVTCIQDGDDKGVLIDNQCYCANKRDLSKILIKVPSQGAVYKDAPKARSYFE